MLLLVHSLEFEGRHCQLNLLILFRADLDFFLIALREIEHFDACRSYHSEFKLVVRVASLSVPGNQLDVILSNLVSVIALALDDAVALLISADFQETWQLFACICTHKEEFKVLRVGVVEWDPPTAGWASDRVLDWGFEARFD